MQQGFKRPYLVLVNTDGGGFDEADAGFAGSEGLQVVTVQVAVDDG